MTVEEPGHVVTAIGGVPIDLDRDYRIATVQGLLGGMDQIAPLIEHARARPEAVPPRDSGREIKVVLVDAFSVELWQHLGRFQDIDADHDGVVNPGELESAITRASAEAPSEIVIQDVLRVFDADGDGRITPQEAEEAVHHTGVPHAGATAGTEPASRGDSDR